MSNWLKKDGDWYLLSREHCNISWESGYTAFIWHSCQQATDAYGGCWRATKRNLNVSCGVCAERCPEGMQGLWLMLNMDIQGD